MQPYCHFEFVADWRDAPMAYWVHVETDGQPWYVAAQFAPSAPQVVPGKGFAMLCVEVGDFVFRFTSPEQIAVCIDVLARNPLPNVQRLSAGRSAHAGPNGHWLSRLPASVKNPRVRGKVVAALAEAQVWAGNRGFGHAISI